VTGKKRKGNVSDNDYGLSRKELMYSRVTASISSDLIAYRALHDLSQKQLAEKLGVSQAYVAQIENSSKNPSIKSLINIASALGGFLSVEMGIVSKAEIENFERKILEKLEAKRMKTSISEGQDKDTALSFNLERNCVTGNFESIENSTPLVYVESFIRYNEELTIAV
jgi:transcriptional regulator with XRE-family HTH domain